MANKPIENINSKLKEQNALNAELAQEAQHLQSVANKWRELNKLAKEHKDTVSKEALSTKQKIAALEREYDSLLKVNKILKETRNEQNAILKDINKTRQSLDEQIAAEEKIKEAKKQQKKEAKDAAALRIKEIKDTSELDDLQRSITSEYGKQYGETAAMMKKIDATKAIVHGLGDYLQKNTKLDERQRQAIEEAADSYKSFPTLIAQLNKERSRGLITDKQMAAQIEEQLSAYDDIIARIDTKDESLRKVLETLKLIGTEERAFAKSEMLHSEKKSAGKQLVGMALAGAPAGIGEIAEGGIGMAESAATLYGKKAIPYVAAATAFAGIAKVISARNKQEVTAMERLYEQLQSLSEYEIKRQEFQIQMNNGIPEAFANFDFDTQLKQAALQFSEISKTAFFGQGLGSVSYATDKLQQMGITAKEIVASMSALSSVGRGANSAVQKLGENAAVFEQATGTSAEEFGSLVSMVRQINKVNGKTAGEFGNKLANTATSTGILYSDLKNQLVGASKDFMFYNDKNLDLLLEQATTVTKMGLDFNKLRETGKGMVLNYNESIKKAMELSSLIGENVDITPALSMFYSGDNAGAAKMLQQSGILEKAQAKGMIAMNSLSSLFGGLDIFKTNAYETEKNPNAKTFETMQQRNNAYLSSGVEAQRTFQIASARLNIERAQIRLGIEEKDQQLLLKDAGVGLLISTMAEREFDKTMGTFGAGIRSVFLGNNGQPFGNPNTITTNSQSRLNPGAKSIISNPDFKFLGDNNTPSNLYLGKGQTPLTPEQQEQKKKDEVDKAYYRVLSGGDPYGVGSSEPGLLDGFLSGIFDKRDTTIELKQSIDTLNNYLKAPAAPIIFLDGVKLSDQLKNIDSSRKGVTQGVKK